MWSQGFSGGERSNCFGWGTRLRLQFWTTRAALIYGCSHGEYCWGWAAWQPVVQRSAECCQRCSQSYWGKMKRLAQLAHLSQDQGDGSIRLWLTRSWPKCSCTCKPCHWSWGYQPGRTRRGLENRTRYFQQMAGLYLEMYLKVAIEEQHVSFLGCPMCRPDMHTISLSYIQDEFKVIYAGVWGRSSIGRNMYVYVWAFIWSKCTACQ